MKVKELLEELKPHLVKKKYKKGVYNIEFDTYIVIENNPPYSIWRDINKSDAIEVNINGTLHFAAKNFFINSRTLHDVVYMIPNYEEIERGKMKRMLNRLVGLSGGKY